MRLLTIEELSQNKSSEKEGQRVVIFDFDDTLAGFDANAVPDDAGAQAPRYLFGGDKLKEKLLALKAADYKLVIATRKNQEGAEEAQDFLRENNIESLFDFMVYGKVTDKKRGMLMACKGHYPENSVFTFIDDDQNNLEVGRELGIMVINPGTSHRT